MLKMKRSPHEPMERLRCRLGSSAETHVKIETKAFEEIFESAKEAP
jgi:hypothetical protein